MTPTLENLGPSKQLVPMLCRHRKGLGKYTTKPYLYLSGRIMDDFLFACLNFLNILKSKMYFLRIGKMHFNYTHTQWCHIPLEVILKLSPKE